MFEAASNGRAVSLDTTYYSEVLSESAGSVGSQCNLGNHATSSGAGDCDRCSLQLTASRAALPAALTGPVYYWIQPGTTG